MIETMPVDPNRSLLDQLMEQACTNNRDCEWLATLGERSPRALSGLVHGPELEGIYDGQEKYLYGQ